MKRTGIFAAGVIAASMLTNVGAFAQTPQKQKDKTQNIVIRTDIRTDNNVVVNTQGPDDVITETTVSAKGAGQSNNFVFITSEFSIDGKIVKNAPYSGDAITETTQNLADGNRIVRKNTASIFRDSEGRTRREQSVTAIGPYGSMGDVPQSIVINDPVAGVSYILDSHSKTARKLGLKSPGMFNMILAPRASAGQGSSYSSGVTVGASGPVATAAPVGTTSTITSDASDILPALPPPAAAGVGISGEARATASVNERVMTYERFQGAETQMHMRVGGGGAPGQAPKVEALGKQLVEGVEADGTRTTVTIPAGQIGNERPIDIVEERWYSPELQTLIMSKRIDPLSGDMTYRLTNINRNEPVRSLFDVPGDYKVKEAMGATELRRATRAPE